MDDNLSSDRLAGYPLLDALRERRSRRFGRGMRMARGPLAYSSDEAPVRLSEEEEAVLAFAACGITGPALGELEYEAGRGGTILAGFVGRTVASGDAIQTASVFVLNQDATYLLKRPRDFSAEEIPELLELSRRGELTELYRRSRVLIHEGRREPPKHPLFNLAVNDWSLYDPAATYFLPVGELTFLYINGVLEILNEEHGLMIVDERRWFRPAGLGRFARGRGGHLHDDPSDELLITLQQLEAMVSEFVTIEQGMVHQNLGLAAQALGLGGFPHWAAHPFGWLEALGFRTTQMRASRYLGMNRLLSTLARLAGKDPRVTLALGLERDGRPLLTPYCPPWFEYMEAAVHSLVEYKYGDGGVYSEGLRQGGFKDPESIARSARRPSDQTIEATVAFCEYVHRRYGRFPAYSPPFRTVLGFQCGHLDTEFYDRFYCPGALSETHRRHMETWHGGSEAAGGE